MMPDDRYTIHPQDAASYEQHYADYWDRDTFWGDDEPEPPVFLPEPCNWPECKLDAGHGPPCEPHPDQREETP